MSRVVLGEPPALALQDPAVKAAVKRLAIADNWTNGLYIARAWLWLAAVVGGAAGLNEARAAHGWSAWWCVPLLAVAVPLVGAGQHQLAGLGHEASHHTLFAQRAWNEIAGDWLCMFPLFSTTHHYRLQHIAHHQYTNDPERDPDVAQLRRSGHWLGFPLAPASFRRELLKALRPLKLIRYVLARAAFGSTGAGANPYAKPGSAPPRLAGRLAAAYLLTVAATLAALTAWAPWPALLVGPALLLAVGLAAFAALPNGRFLQTRLKGHFTQKQLTLQRLAFMTLTFAGLAWATRWTGRPVWGYFLALWALPLLTSFSFFMILRQLVQHGNADRGWLSNTRVFLMNPLARFAIFPAGQDYHLPHHMYASVPHYNLKRLHETLMGARDYAAAAVVVEGYFAPRRPAPRPPTAVEIVGPDHAARGHAVHLDHSVLDTMVVEGRNELLREASPDGR